MNKRDVKAGLSLLAVLAAAPAWAADPAPALKAAAATNWSGFYLGAVAGGALQNTMFDDKVGRTSFGSLTLGSTGVTAGVTAGWNVQSGAALFGIEADVSWANLKASLTDPYWGGGTTLHASQWNWFSTIRGRAGLVSDRALIYVTGGVAFVDTNAYGRRGLTSCSVQCFEIDGVRTGWAAGAGFEYALSGPWSVKGEYLYVGLPTERRLDDIDNAYNVKSDAHILRVGLNYHGRPLASAMTSQTPVASDWSGFYVGAVAGGALQTTMIAEKNGATYALDGSGATAGVTLGWNYQSGSGLVGIEGDINWVNFEGRRDFPEYRSPSTNWDWFSTVRGRAGLVADRALLYVTGGVAFVHADVSLHDSDPCSVNSCFDISGTKTGLTGGVGAEYALSGPWSAKAEYLYVGLPSKTIQPGTSVFNVQSDAHILRAGLNYHGHRIAPADRAPAFNWSGFYVGAVAGGGLQNTVINSVAQSTSYTAFNLDGSGATAGGTLGWNYQAGAAVLGLEGDLNWANFASDFFDPTWGATGSIHSSEWNWFATVRGRFGLAVDRALIYVTGGVALVDADFSASFSCGANPRYCFSSSGVRTGLAAGAGVEYALSGPWSLKGEYLYVGLPTRYTNANAMTVSYDTYSVTSDAHILRAGINYRFAN